jgi:precorrin-6B methylase 2
MSKSKEYRLTVFLEEKEYKKLKLIAKNLRKQGADNGSISKLSAKLLSVLIEALDDDETESRLVLSSIIDKEKNIKAILEKIQNDIDNLKIIEEFIFLTNVKKAIKKMKEDSTETTEEKIETKVENRENEKIENKEEEEEEEERRNSIP